MAFLIQYEEMRHRQDRTEALGAGGKTDAAAFTALAVLSLVLARLRANCYAPGL